jgi:TPR repeat protein
MFCICAFIAACASQQQRLAQGKTFFIQQDYHQAFKTLEPLAVQGIPEAQYAVGYMYFYGYGTPQNNTLALKWMQSASAQGFSQADKALDLIRAQMVTQATAENPTFTDLPPNYAAAIPTTAQGSDQ